jgi:GNAT superfamily N-acetyltransferase
MANDLNDHVGIHGRPFTPERICADAFGPQAAFTPLVAELDGAVVGYAFFSLGYNTDFAARSMWLHDLFVAPAARGRGVGYALMTAVAAETVRAAGVGRARVQRRRAGVLPPVGRGPLGGATHERRRRAPAHSGPCCLRGYVGGVGAYRKKCDEVATRGYEGFTLTA